MVSLRVSMRHPITRFLDFHATSHFVSFFSKFGFCRMDLLGVLGLKTLYMA